MTVVNLLLPCHVVLPAILQFLIALLFRLAADVLCSQSLYCNTAKCSFSEACLLWEAIDELWSCVHLLFHVRVFLALLFICIFSCRVL